MYVPLKKYLTQIHSQKLRVLHERNGSQQCSDLQQETLTNNKSWLLLKSSCIFLGQQNMGELSVKHYWRIYSYKTTLWYCFIKGAFYTLSEVIWIKTSHHYHRLLFIELEGAFFWGDAHQNQWFKITQRSRRSRVRFPLKPWFFSVFFQLLKLEIYCNDHSSLSSTTAVQIRLISFILNIQTNVNVRGKSPVSYYTTHQFKNFSTTTSSTRGLFSSAFVRTAISILSRIWSWYLKARHQRQ